MQEAFVSPANAHRHRSALELKPFAFGDQHLSSPRYFAGGDDALFHCSSPFSPSFGFSSPSPLATPVSLSPSSSASLVDDGDTTAVAANVKGQRLRLARLALQYQEVADRYELCLAHLAETSDEAAALRRENAELRFANSDLAGRLALLRGKQTAAVAIADEIRRLRSGEQNAIPAAAERVHEKPTLLPKSIPVRSKDYVKMNHATKAPATPVANNRKPRTSNPTMNSHSSSPFGCSRLAISTLHSSDTSQCCMHLHLDTTQQRFYAGAEGSMKGEEAKEQRAAGGVELEVYNQGMFKTELCNKWEKTGACPYGDQCQFAHGVAELRPVIHHARYKTQVCRMVLAGEPCPYGHRCHFRHTFTPAERLLPCP